MRPAGATARQIVLEAVHEGETITIDLTEMPEKDGFVFVLGQAPTKRRVVKAADVRLVRAFREFDEAAK